jgi:hypothetical protein
MKFTRSLAIAMLILAGCATTEPAGAGGRWLLLVPRIGADGTAEVSQPLPRWEVVEYFGTQSDCNYSLTRQKFLAHGAFGPIGSAQSAYQAEALQTMKAQCVAATDPRLEIK